MIRLHRLGRAARWCQENRDEDGCHPGDTERSREHQVSDFQVLENSMFLIISVYVSVACEDRNPLDAKLSLAGGDKYALNIV